MMNILRNPNTAAGIFWVVFFLITISASLGQVMRWDLLEQIAMADNFLLNGKLYPEIDATLPHGVSVYFPGAAFIATGLQLFGIKTLVVEVMYLIASISLIAFLLCQIFIAQRMAPNISFFSGTLITIPFCILVVGHWWEYAREFKPDTIALLFGYAGLIISSMLLPSANKINVVLGAIICGMGLLFKQQYSVFILGALIFCFIFPTKNKLIFAFTLTTVAGVISYYFITNPLVVYWNMLVLSDDGMLPILVILQGNYPTVVNVVFLITGGLVLKLLHEQRQKQTSIKYLQKLRNLVISSPLPWVVAPTIIAAIASAFKVGGNHGNTQLAVVVLLPFIIILFNQINTRLSLIITLWAITSSATLVYSGSKNYFAALELKRFVRSIPAENASLMTGSDVYFASRSYGGMSKPNTVYNYWSISLRDGTTLEEAFQEGKYLEPEYIVVEPFDFLSKEKLEKDGKYKVIFANRVGSVAKMK